jgi:hypothetical protein
MCAGLQCPLNPFRSLLQGSFQKAFSHKTNICGGRLMAYARFQANDPRSWTAASLNNWIYVDDLDQVETALHTIAALQSDAPSSKPSVRAADTSPEFIPHICSARMNQILASGTQPWSWVS